MSNLQAFIDELSDGWRDQRAKTQMTLGKMIERLEELDSSITIAGIGEPDSYRGYYSDLAFSNASGMTRNDLLKRCKEALGETFIGYKGGEFIMDKNTPLWVADYGCSGSKIIGINDDGTLETEADT